MYEWWFICLFRIADAVNQSCLCRVIYGDRRDRHLSGTSDMHLNENIYYVGVNDRMKTLFESLWPLPQGISYNSYLIVDERVALIDTVDVNSFEEHLRRIRRVIGNRPIDYLVINHMEPDHSGCINLIRQYYPEITLVGNVQTLHMVDGFYGTGGTRLTVNGCDVLPLGRRMLTFHLTPMVHWPETMMTFSPSDGMLFSGDAFGCFGSLNGGVTDTAIDTSPYWGEMVRYYSNIVGKYGTQVQKALQKLSHLPIRMICPTHGPVWTKEVNRVVTLYDRMSRYEADNGLVICYGSMYGNTLRMAELIAETASEAGVRTIRMHDVSRTHHSYILADVFRYRGLVVGAPTYNGNLFPEMENLLKEITSRGVRHRLFGYFGSFTWAGQSVKHIKSLTEGIQWESAAPPVEMKQGELAQVEEGCRALGRGMAHGLVSLY